MVIDGRSQWDIPYRVECGTRSNRGGTPVCAARRDRKGRQSPRTSARAATSTQPDSWAAGAIRHRRRAEDPLGVPGCPSALGCPSAGFRGDEVTGNWDLVDPLSCLPSISPGRTPRERRHRDQPSRLHFQSLIDKTAVSVEVPPLQLEFCPPVDFKGIDLRLPEPVTISETGNVGGSRCPMRKRRFQGCRQAIDGASFRK